MIDYLLNFEKCFFRVSLKSINKTPYEIWNGRRQILSYFNI